MLMSSEKRDWEANRLANFPHFNDDRQLSTCLDVNKTDDGYLFFNVIGNGREIKGGKMRTSTKLNRGEVAQLWFALKSWLENK